MIKTIINTYWQSTIKNGISFLSINQFKKVQHIKFLITLFYFFILLISIQTFSSFSQFPEWDTVINSQYLFEPIWSIQWIKIFNWGNSVRAIYLFFCFSSILGVLFGIKSRLIRTIVFLSMFFYLSLIFSYGKIDHYMHLALIVSFMLIFIPNKSVKNSNNDLIKVFFSIQTFILLTYFMSGIFKIYGIFDQEISGLESALSFDSLAQNSSKTSFYSNNYYFFSKLLLKNNSIIFSIILIIGYLIEFFSIYVVFKPKYHKVYGFTLILLHLGILMTVGPDFTMQIVIIGVFLFFSPFTQSSFTSNKGLKSIYKRLRKTFLKSSKQNTRVIIFYGRDCSTCNDFLVFISNYNLPTSLKISNKKSAAYYSLIQKYPDLNEINSIVITEVLNNKKPSIYIKTDAILWILSKFRFHFKLIRMFYLTVPFFGNIIYDIIIKNQKKVDSKDYPTLPIKLQNHILN